MIFSVPLSGGEQLAHGGDELRQVEPSPVLAKCNWPWWIRTTINGSKVAGQGRDLTVPAFVFMELAEIYR